MDRGNKLWTGFFLPEHKEALREQWLKQKEISPPELDIDQREEIDYVLNEAIHTNGVVTVKYAGKYEIEEVVGLVDSVQLSSKRLYISHGEEITEVQLNTVIDVRLK